MCIEDIFGPYFVGQMAATKINIDLQKMIILNWLIWSLVDKCCLDIVCTYIETQNPDVTMKVEIVVLYYGMSVDHSLRILRYIQIIMSC